MFKSKKGFTLLEMMLVVGITVVVSGVGVVTVASVIQDSKSQRDQYEMHANNIDSAQTGVHNILVERTPNVPVSGIKIDPGVNNTNGKENGGNNGDNGNHYGNGSNNGNTDNPGNHYGNENGNGNNGTNGSTDDKTTGTNNDTNTNTNGGSNTIVNNNDTNNNNNNNHNNNHNNGSSNGNGWGVGTDNGHGQTDKQGTITVNANSKDDLQTNTKVQSTGNRGIKTLTITVPDNVKIKGVGNANNGGRYDVSHTDHTITLEVKTDSWVTPATTLDVNNITWDGPQNFELTYDIVYVAN